MTSKTSMQMVGHNLNKLEKVLIFSKRLGFKKDDKKGGLMCFAWFVFDINYNGKPTIDWI